MKSYSVLIVGLLFTVSSLSAQEGGFVSGGKPIMVIFSNFNTTLTNGEAISAFELRRVYLGYEHDFNEHLSGKAVLDVGNPGVGNLQMTAYVKNAYLKYGTDRLAVNFGMIPTVQFKVQESAWGYRYVAKSLQNEFGFNSSADLGISATYNISELIGVDIIVTNGDGYKSIQADSTFRTGAGLTLKPLKNLTARVYYDYSNNLNRQSSLAGFLGYADNKFSVGAEYSFQSQPTFVAESSWSGTSFYSKYNINDKFNLFGRFDMLTSNRLPGETDNWNLEGDGQYYIFGFEYSPVRGVRFAPNFKGWNPSDISKYFVYSFFLNLEIKL